MVKNQKKESKKLGIDFTAIEKARKYEVKFYDIDSEIDGDKVKTLRNQLNMSQTFFAEVLGLSKKTIEKWEQGKNPIKGTSSRLLYLIEKDHALLDSFFSESRTSSPVQAKFRDDFLIIAEPVNRNTNKYSQNKNKTYENYSQVA
eukprot:Anaeramoba_ignava/a103054_25.p2 GENE.a103054_25~~a103054_25.p2  ORF type:complete len:145 (-),score=29.66 a103054_25:87-521(-)